MKKLSLKILGILIIAILLLQTSAVFATSDNTILNSQKNENNKKITEKQSDLEDVKEEKSQTQQQVNDLSTKYPLSKLQEHISGNT